MSNLGRTEFLKRDEAFRRVADGTVAPVIVFRQMPVAFQDSMNELCKEQYGANFVEIDVRHQRSLFATLAAAASGSDHPHATSSASMKQGLTALELIEMVQKKQVAVASIYEALEPTIKKRFDQEARNFGHESFEAMPETLQAELFPILMLISVSDGKPQSEAVATAPQRINRDSGAPRQFSHPDRKPTSPKMSGGTLVKKLDLGQHEGELWKDRTGRNNIEYLFTLSVTDRTSNNFVLAVTAETSAATKLFANSKGPNAFPPMLCVFQGENHVNYGPSFECNTIEAFEQKALELVKETLGEGARLSATAVSQRNEKPTIMPSQDAESTFVFLCPHCGESLRIREEHAGMTGKCNKCGGRITVNKGA